MLVRPPSIYWQPLCAPAVNKDVAIANTKHKIPAIVSIKQKIYKKFRQENILPTQIAQAEIKANALKTITTPAIMYIARITAFIYLSLTYCNFWSV